MRNDTLYFNELKSEIQAPEEFVPLTFESLREVKIPTPLVEYLNDPMYATYSLDDKSMSVVERTILLQNAALDKLDMNDSDYIEANGPGGGLTLVGHLLHELNDALENNTFSIINTDNPPESKSGISILNSIFSKQEDFIQIANGKEHLLVDATELFKYKIHHAIDHQGFPLTHEQIDDRLKDIQIGFYDSYGRGEHSDEGEYESLEKRININLYSSPEGLNSVVFHELLHAISGHSEDDNKVGLAVKSPIRTWLNEAVTDLLSILLDEDTKGIINYSDPEKSLWEEFKNNIEEHPLFDRAYGLEKSALIASLSKVPPTILMAAYLKQDRDPYEKDQRAGAHALRDLERYIKGLGGVDRVKMLRNTGRDFIELSRTWSPSIDAKKNILDRVRQAGIYDSDPKNDAQRVINRRAVLHNSADVQRRILRAKSQSKIRNGSK